MTAPAAPAASVPIGPSEIASYVTILAGLLTTFFGSDFGLGQNAQTVGMVVSGLVVIGSSIARALKHRAALQAATQVHLAQVAAISAIASSAPTDQAPVDPAQVVLATTDQASVAPSGGVVEAEVPPHAEATPGGI
ncbi:MAG: hypothetical protein ACXVYY_00905 [Oryzihumus sp.]